MHYFEGDPAVADIDPELAAAALNRGVEQCIGQFPTHYQWAYRRFEIPGAEHPSPYARKKA
jgi:KDO2-lipid IV(A) lauroyltransferase